MMQPSALTPDQRVPAEKFFDHRLDLISPGLDILVRNSQHLCNLRLPCSQALTSQETRCRNLIPVVLEKREVQLFGSAQQGTGLTPGMHSVSLAERETPAKAGSPLREIL